MAVHLKNDISSQMKAAAIVSDFLKTNVLINDAKTLEERILVISEFLASHNYGNTNLLLESDWDVLANSLRKSFIKLGMNAKELSDQFRELANAIKKEDTL